MCSEIVSFSLSSSSPPVSQSISVLFIILFSSCIIFPQDPLSHTLCISSTSLPQASTLLSIVPAIQAHKTVSHKRIILCHGMDMDVIGAFTRQYFSVVNKTI